MSAIYHLLDVQLELDAPEEVIGDFDRMYGGLRDVAACGWPEESPSVSIRVEVARAEMAWAIETPWGKLVASPAELMVHLLFLAQNHVLRNSRAFCAIHAASLEIEGQGVLLSAPSATGKTTLAGALAARGAKLLSDEVGALHVTTGALHAFPRAVAFRPDVLELLSMQGEPVRLGDEEKILSSPSELCGGNVPTTTRLRRFVFLCPPPEHAEEPCLELSLSIAPDSFAERVAELDKVISTSWLEGRSYRTLRIVHQPGTLLVRDIDRLVSETGTVVAGHHRGRSTPIDYSAAPQHRELSNGEGLRRLLPCILNAEALNADSAPGQLLMGLSRLLDGVQFLEVVPGRLEDTAALVAQVGGASSGS